MRNLAALALRPRLGRGARRSEPAATRGRRLAGAHARCSAFVVSAALAGVAGAFFAVQKTVVTPDDFTADFSIFFLLIVVLGGPGRLWGPVIGALVFFLVPELLAGAAELAHADLRRRAAAA